jgi:hypothetical protein
MSSGMILSASFAKAVCIFLLLGVVGFFGGVAVYGQLLGAIAGSLSSLIGTTVRFDGEMLVMIHDSQSLLQLPLEFHPNFSYAAVPLLVGLIGATPDLSIGKRMILGLVAPVGILIIQAFLLIGFSLIDTSTPKLFEASRSAYTAFWSIGPLLFAAWWFWSYWLPPIVSYHLQKASVLTTNTSQR